MQPSRQPLLLVLMLCVAACTAALAAAEGPKAPAATPLQPSTAAALKAKPAQFGASKHIARDPASPDGDIVLPLTTQGRYIVDAVGKRVRLSCVSWSGGQEKWYSPAGLWVQHRREIARLARQGGFNCVRLSFSTESIMRSALEGVIVGPQAVAANPDLVGKTPLEVMDAVIDVIAEEGMMVILDNHSSDALWCCNVHDGNGMWYTAKWTEADWLQQWDILAKRYANNLAVVGLSLRNEPRPVFHGGGMLPRLPTWGFGPANLDYTVAYKKAAAVVLDARDSYLIMAQGFLGAPDLRLAALSPLTLKTSNGTVMTQQLVYEIHEYPWFWLYSFKYNGPIDFNDYALFKHRLDEAWGFVVTKKIAPLWISEFGTSHTKDGLKGSWWKSITRYIRERDLEWCYWALDGTQGPSRDIKGIEPYGLLNGAYTEYTYPPLLDALRMLM